MKGCSTTGRGSRGAMGDDAAETEVARADAMAFELAATTVLCLTAGTGDRRGFATPRRCELERRLPARRVGSTPATPRGVAGPAEGGLGSRRAGLS